MEKIQEIAMQYLGALKLLAETSIMLGNTPEAEETREMIAQALIDAQQHFPHLKWKRMLQRFEVWIELDAAMASMIQQETGLQVTK